MALNLNVVNLTDTVEQLVSKLNENFNIISTGNGGAEGKKGDSGYAGLPGPRGLRGQEGSKGDRGTKWYSANSTSTFPNDALVGDYVVIKNTLDFYEKISNDEWNKRGTFNLTKDFTIDLENISYVLTNVVADTPLDMLINAKTNHTLLLTNIDRPDSDLPPQIPVYDIPGDSYPLIQKGSDNSLFDYKMKMYNSGDTKTSSTQLYGRHIHLANSYAMLRKEGWGLSSGFTMSIDLDINNTTTDGAGIELFRINGISSGNTNHRHRVEINNSDFWASSFRVFKDGFITLGYTNTYIAKQKFDVNGAIKIGDTNTNEPGSIRFKNNIFEGYNESRGWFNLGVSHIDILNSMNTDLTSFNGFLIDTSLDGAIVVGDGSGYTAKRGMIRINPITGYFEGYNGTSWNILTNLVNTTTSGGGSGSGGGGGGTGSGFEDENGDPINFKLAIGIDTVDDGTETFQGFALTSSDNTVLFKSETVDSKYTVIDLSAKNSLGLTDKDGNLSSATSFDIESDDIDVKKSVDGDKLTYNLSIDGSEKFKDVVSKSLDFRSSDATLIVTPPSSDKSFWDLRLPESISQGGAMGGIGGGIGGGSSKVSAMRYTETTEEVDLVYSVNYSGYFAELPFQTKDFDENCNVISVNPLYISIKDKQSGYYDVSARIRFKITDVTGTFTSVKLAIVKENVIISVLEKIGSTDIFFPSFSSSKTFELSGSDLVDMGCASGDCDDKFKFILVVTGLTQGTVVIEESNVAVHKVSTLTKNNLEEVLNDSKQFFKTLNVVDKANTSTIISTTESFDNNGIIKIKNAEYLNVGVQGGILSIDANIGKILAEIDPDETKLKESFSSFNIISPYTTPTTYNVGAQGTQGLFGFQAGNNITLTLDSNKMRIDANQVQLGFQSGTQGLLASSVNKVIVDSDDFNFVKSDSDKTLTLSLKDEFKTSNKSVHIKTDYSSDWGDYSYLDQSEDEVIFGYLDYNQLPAILRYSGVDGDYDINEDIGDLFDESVLTDSFIFTPTETGKYNLSCSVGYNPLALGLGLNGNNNIVLTESKVSLGIFKIVDGGGDNTLKNHLDSVGAELISILDGDVVKFIPDNIFNLDRYPKHLTHRLTGSVILPLESGQKYSFGLFRGIDGESTNFVNVLKSGSSAFISSVAQLKIFVYDNEISISKL